MNQRERALAWATASRERCHELCRDEPWPNELYIAWGDKQTFSPLGYVCARGLSVRPLLENGANALAIAWREESQSRNALELCAKYHAKGAFDELIEHMSLDVANAVISGYWVFAKRACGCREAFDKTLARYARRNACFVAVGWALCQLSRDDLIEPVVQRLAKIPLDSWDAERPKKKIK